MVGQQRAKNAIVGIYIILLLVVKVLETGGMDEVDEGYEGVLQREVDQQDGGDV